MTKNTSFLKSLYHALCGLRDAIKSERNLRFHIVIGNLICFFAVHFGISRAEWAVLFATIGAVISCELINSGIEKAVDTATEDFNENARLSKDFGAAATLVCAVFALAVGGAIFGDLEKIILALKMIFTTPVSIAVLIVLAILDLRILFAL